METRKKILILVLLPVYGTLVLYSSLRASKLYPGPVELASGYTWIRDAENALNRRSSRTPIDLALGATAEFLGLSQQWNTFAPVPPHVVARVEVVATPSNGEPIVLWTNGRTLEESGVGIEVDTRTKLTEILSRERFEKLRTSILRSLVISNGIQHGQIQIVSSSYQNIIDPTGQLKRTPVTVRVLSSMAW